MELCGAQESLKDIRCGVVWSPGKSKGHKMWSSVEPMKVYRMWSSVESKQALGSIPAIKIR